LFRVGSVRDPKLADLLTTAPLDFVGRDPVVDDDRIVVAGDVDGVVPADGIP